MKLTTGEEITRTDPYRRKYNSALAEYVHGKVLCGMLSFEGTSYDGTTIDRVAPKKLLIEDSYGFVELFCYATEKECDDAYRFYDNELTMRWAAQ